MQKCPRGEGKSVGTLLVSVSRHSKYIKIKIKTDSVNKVHNLRNERGTYTKTLAKIQGRGIFRIRDIRRNVSPKLVEISMETPCWCSPR